MTVLDALYWLFQPPKDKYGYYFYDLVGKLSYVTGKHGLYLSAYGGKDRFWMRYTDTFYEHRTEKYRGRLDWGNLTTTLRWQGQLSPTLLANASLARTAYAFEFDEHTATVENDTGDEDASSISFLSGITDYSARGDVQYVARRGYTVRLGGVAARHRFVPSSSHVADTRRPDELAEDAASAAAEQEPVHAVSAALYAEGSVNPTNALSMVLGFRLSSFFAEGTREAFPEPRLAV